MSETANRPVHLRDAAAFDEHIAAEPVVLVDYHAEWCGPCKMLEPTIQELADEYPVSVLKVDVDEHQTLARDHQVRSVPTIEVYADGEQAERFIGVQDKQTLAGVIEPLAD
jgi:thioredoxin 1